MPTPDRSATGSVERIRTFVASVGAPIRPFRLVLALVRRAAWAVPLGLSGGAVLLYVASRMIVDSFGEGAFAAVGSWSVTTVLTLAGALLGAALALVRTADHVLDTAQVDLTGWFERLPRDDGARLFPSTELETLRKGYDGTLDAMFDATLGRLPMPRFVRRLARSRFRQAMVDDFLEQCEGKGVAVVGFSEVRDYVARRAIPVVARPAHVWIGLWTAVLAGALTLFTVLLGSIGLLAGTVSAGTVVVGTCGLAGILVLALGIGRADRHPRPRRFVGGLVIIAASLWLWPVVWLALWDAGSGSASIVLLAGTVLTFRAGMKRILAGEMTPA